MKKAKSDNGPKCTCIFLNPPTPQEQMIMNRERDRQRVLMADILRNPAPAESAFLKSIFSKLPMPVLGDADVGIPDEVSERQIQKGKKKAKEQ
jgi:hypothetical protein